VAGVSEDEDPTGFAAPDLLALLAPEPVEGEADVFRMPSMRTPLGGAFGGQVISQSAIAAMQTVEPDRIIHSLHAYFLRPGDARRPISYRVERLRDGRSFSARRVQAFQDDVPILSGIASFETPAEGIDHAEPPPALTVPPEELPKLAEQLAAGSDTVIAPFWRVPQPFDIRITTWPGQDQDEVGARSAVWMRAVQDLPADENLHRAALAFASDYTLLQPIFRRHGIVRLGQDYRVASLDHAIWWHRPIRVDDWFLYAQHSPNGIGARGLAHGELYSREGVLGASTAQEGMIRPRRATRTATPTAEAV
jgi:acyl-CoA thioesterase II